jgi:hypothetical protein
MRSNARLDTSNRGLPHPLRDGGAVVDGLSGVHSAMMKWLLFVVNRSCMHKGV